MAGKPIPFRTFEGYLKQFDSSALPFVEQELAVLIHQPQELPGMFSDLDFIRLPGLDDGQIFLYRLPYQITRRKFQNVIDLRLPEVREWFYGMFRDPSQESDSALISSPAAELIPTTAHSRFHLVNGQPPTPDDFWSMLPTLVNPDLGGGSHADTGSTLLMIGHWLRQHGVDALIYPSARADIEVLIENGALKSWIGWNLLDFENSPVFGNPQMQLTTFVFSPWAWVRCPSGVRLQVAESDSRLSGSFSLTGMVNYWATDYLTQLKALEVARSIYG